MSLVPMFSETMYKQVVEGANGPENIKTDVRAQAQPLHAETRPRRSPQTVPRRIRAVRRTVQKGLVGGAALDPQITAFFRDLES